MGAEARLLELNPVVPVKQMQESLDFYVSPPSGDGPGTIGGHAAHQDTCGEHRGPL